MSNAARQAASPFEQSQAWDSPAFYTDKGRVTLPGRCVVKTTAGIKEDSKDVDGQDGRTVTFLGHDAAAVDIAVTVYNDEQFTKLKGVLELLRPRPPAKPKPIGIAHPSCALLGVTSVYIFAVSIPPFDPATEWVIDITCKEWAEEISGQIKPKPKPKPYKGNTPKQAGSSKGAGGTKPAAKAAQAAPPSSKPPPLPANVPQL